MKAVDTNVLARLILKDDERQTAQACEIVRHPVWVSNTVWVELGWVLGQRLGMARSTIADAIDTLLAMDTIHTADRPGLSWAIERYRQRADWADMVHLAAARGAADAFITFDQAISRQRGENPPIPVETLG